jgi:outer membrane protein assembly factor BamA
MKILFILFLVLSQLTTFCQVVPIDTAVKKVVTKPLKKNKQILLLPVIAKSIETSWSGGLAVSATFNVSKTDTLSRTSSVQGLALYSLKNQFIAAINGTQYFKNEEYILSEQLSFSSFPDKFWGLGKNAPEEAMEEYSFKQYYIDFHLQRNLGHQLFAGVIFEAQNVLNVQYKQGGLFDTQNVTGKDGYFVCGLGLSFTYDSRNHAFVPNKGNFAQVYFNHFDRYLASKYVYTNIVVDLRKYIAINKKNVLALQLFSFSNLGKEVPLRSLANLGGSNSMRGFFDGRFRDKQQLVFQAEYRFPLYKRFAATSFGGVGDVGNGVTDFSFPDLKYTYGAGLRYAINKSEKLNIRLDYGFNSLGSSGLYLQLGEAF